jgi:NADH:ubiquinone oxidoreductase subunit
MKILEKLFLFFNKAQLVGQDYYGNSYYLLKTKDAFGRQIRYVQFFKPRKISHLPPIKISSIPPLWAGWLRYSINNINTVNTLNNEKPSFVKPHQPNLTGIEGCYYPTNHILNKRNSEKSKFYHSWLNI